MSIFSIRPRRRPLVQALPLAGALAAALLAWPQAGIAGHEGPFAGFAGDWRGAGRVVTTDGQSATISCRASYNISSGGESLSQSLVCASDAYRFEITSSAIAQGGGVTGEWREATRGVGGHLRGQIENGDFEGSVDGPGFTASISLRTNGRRQTVEITPQEGFISRVDVSLRRER